MRIMVVQRVSKMFMRMLTSSDDFNRKYQNYSSPSFVLKQKSYYVNPFVTFGPQMDKKKKKKKLLHTNSYEHSPGFI